MTSAERKTLIALSKQDTGDPHLNEMLKEVIKEKLIQEALPKK